MPRRRLLVTGCERLLVTGCERLLVIGCERETIMRSRRRLSVTGVVRVGGWLFGPCWVICESGWLLLGLVGTFIHSIIHSSIDS